jgi:hypothetical protein
LFKKKAGDIFSFCVFGSFYSHLYHNFKACGAHVIAVFLKQRFEIILINTFCNNHQNGYKNMVCTLQFSRIQAYFSPCSVSFVLIGEYIQYSPLINFHFNNLL